MKTAMAFMNVALANPAEQDPPGAETLGRWAVRIFYRPAGAPYPVIVQREARLAIISALLGHSVVSFKELTSVERSAVHDLLNANWRVIEDIKDEYERYVTLHTPRSNSDRAFDRGEVQSNFPF